VVEVAVKAAAAKIFSNVLIPNTVPMVMKITLATLQIVDLATPKTLSLNCRTQITPAVLLEFVKAKMVSVSLRVNA